jgi:hypothetical protein
MGDRKVIPLSQQLVRISPTLPAWQCELLGLVGSQWRTAVGYEYRITDADALRAVIACGLDHVMRAIAVGDNTALENLWRRVKRAELPSAVEEGGRVEKTGRDKNVR